MNPDDEITTMARRWFLKKLPSLSVFLEGLGNVAWQGWDNRFCGVGIVHRRSGKEVAVSNPADLSSAHRFRLRFDHLPAGCLGVTFVVTSPLDAPAAHAG
jgi:hypothetical protein